MKMRLIGFIAFALLSISILFYGIADSAFATSNPNPALPVSTDIEIVSNGVSVTVSGKIPDYDASSGYGLTYVILTPPDKGNVAIVEIGQPIPNSDGSFEDSFVVGGPLWKIDGDYTIKFEYRADTSEVSIKYVGGEQIDPSPPIKDIPPPEKRIEPPPTEKRTEPPPPVDVKDTTCGTGTELVNGVCQAIVDDKSKPGGSCLIATAAYGTELAPQVQLLREVRDNTVMSTASGVAFMTGFNQLYYSFAPTIADMERENAIFQEVVRSFITPMISTLSIMTLADEGSEVEVLVLGISVIALNLGMYIVAPALIGFKVYSHFKSRK